MHALKGTIPGRWDGRTTLLHSNFFGRAELMVKMTDLSQKEKGYYLFSDITGCCCSTGVAIRQIVQLFWVPAIFTCKP
jgi:hypothetical protein